MIKLARAKLLFIFMLDFYFNRFWNPVAYGSNDEFGVLRVAQGNRSQDNMQPKAACSRYFLPVLWQDFIKYRNAGGG